MHKLRIIVLGGVFLLAAGRVAAAPEDCDVGTYASSDGNAVALAMRKGRLAYTFLDGRRGFVEGNSLGIDCRHGEVRTAGPEGKQDAWKRVRFKQTVTRFESDGVTLFGRLIEPVNPATSPPLAVLAHGSESSPWASGEGEEPWFALIGLLASQDISVFIFDKRGTGESGGEFNMNFHKLAGDLVAATREARRLADDRYSRFGLMGFSQGGWVAPLAAMEVNPDFLLVSYGALYSPLDEAWEEVRYTLIEQEYGDEALRGAKELLDVAAEVRISELHTGFDELTSVREKYRNEAWFEIIETREDWAGELTREPVSVLRENAGSNKYDLAWTHDGQDVIRALDTPQLWIFAEQDHIAPIRVSVQRLTAFQQVGKPIRLAIFPDTDHGIVEFERQADGTRAYTKYAEGYIRLLVDWAKNDMRTDYGQAVLQ